MNKLINCFSVLGHACLIGGMILIATSAAADLVDREDAQETLDGNTAFILGNLNTTMPLFGETLIWNMARPLGDDPRVLQTCLTVVTKSTTPANVEAAVSAIDIILGSYRASVPKEQNSAVAEALRHALTYDNRPKIRSGVVTGLLLLDRTNVSEVQSIYRRWFKRGQEQHLPAKDLISLVGCLQIEEALALCKDVLERGTETPTVSTALLMIKGELEDSPSISTLTLSGLASSVRSFVDHTDLTLNDRLNAIELTRLLDPRQSDHDLQMRLIEQPGSLASPAARWRYIGLVRQIADGGNPNDKPILCHAILKNNVRETLKAELSKMYGTSAKEWRAVLDNFDAIVSDRDHCD